MCSYGELMQRRDAIKLIVAVMGSSISPSILRAFDGEVVSEGTSFSESQRDLVDAMTARIIPATDTPGAIEAGVPQFVEEIVTQWYTEAERKIFEQGCIRLDNLSSEQFLMSFVELSADQKDKILTQLEFEAGRPNMGGGISLEMNLEEDLSPFFHKLKELVVVGYYTSEIGATQELRYDPMPMEYKGDIPLTEVGRGSSDNGFF
jgi:hypothetical protein